MMTGIPASAGTGLAVIDTDMATDPSSNHLDIDSDGDGCSDANEYYDDSTADAGDPSGTFGGANPSVNPNGTVVAASYPAVGADTDTNATADYAEVGPDPDTDTISNACDLDDDNDGNPDATAMIGMSQTIDLLSNDDFLPDNTSTPGSDVYITDAGTGSGNGIIVFDENTGELIYTPSTGEGGRIVTVTYTVCNDLTNDGVVLILVLMMIMMEFKII